jgi:aminoglycoside phosphotransferase (APT) family kinase protein
MPTSRLSGCTRGLLLILPSPRETILPIVAGICYTVGMTITERHILNACIATFPQRLNMRLGDVRSLPGNQHEMMLFELLWDEREQTYTVELVFRRYCSPLSWHNMRDTNRAEREFEVLRWLGHNRFPTPPALYSGLDDEGDYLIMGVVTGHSWETLSEELRMGAVQQLINLLVQLHGLEPGGLRQMPSITVEEIIARYRGWAAESGDGAARDAISEAASLVDVTSEQAAAPLNMAADVSDLLVSDTGRITAWLDWENAMIGDPRWDIAWLVEQLRRAHQMPDLADLALERYQVASGSTFDDLSSWAALLAAMRLVRCAWAREHQNELAFPGLQNLLASYDEYRAWVDAALSDAR